MSAIKPGDIVTIGRSTLTWEVEDISPRDAFGGPRLAARLRSGQTGRRRAEWLSNLRKHPYQKEAA